MAGQTDLVINNPGGVIELEGAVWVEGGYFELWFDLEDSDGQPIDMTGCTTVYASMDRTINGGSLMQLTLVFTATGFKLIPNLASATQPNVVAWLNHPNGRDVIISARIKLANTWEVWLIKPSRIHVQHMPGSGT